MPGVRIDFYVNRFVGLGHGVLESLHIARCNRPVVCAENCQHRRVDPLNVSRIGRHGPVIHHAGSEQGVVDRQPQRPLPSRGPADYADFQPFHIRARIEEVDGSLHVLKGTVPRGAGHQFISQGGVIGDLPAVEIDGERHITVRRQFARLFLDPICHAPVLVEHQQGRVFTGGGLRRRQVTGNRLRTARNPDVLGCDRSREQDGNHREKTPGQY